MDPRERILIRTALDYMCANFDHACDVYAATDEDGEPNPDEWQLEDGSTISAPNAEELQHILFEMG